MLDFLARRLVSGDSIQPVAGDGGRPGAVGRVALLAGLLGFALGALVFPTNHEAVQIAQVVAGVVDYPPCNPFGWYQKKVWTIYIQLLALLLNLGVSEKTLCYLMSGVFGMVSYQALALCVFALSRNTLLAVISAPLIHIGCYWTVPAPHTIRIMGHWSSQNSLGSAGTLLGVALVGAGGHRVGAFLLGLIPAVHPAWGAAAWASLAGSYLWSTVDSNRGDRAWQQSAGYFFAAGVATAAASLVFHLVFTYPEGCPKPQPEVLLRFRESFLSTWGYHQGSLLKYPQAFLLNTATIIAAWTALTRLRENASDSCLFLLRYLVTAGALVIALAVVTCAPASWAPLILQEVNPGRFVNLSVLALPALIIGLLIQPTDRGGHPIIIYAALSMLVLAGMLCLGDAPVRVVRALSVGAIVAAFGLTCLLNSDRDSLKRMTQRIYLPSLNAVPILRAAVVGGSLLLLLVLVAVRATSGVEHATCFRRFWSEDAEAISDWKDDPLYAHLAAEKGLVASATCFYFVQVRTRRPCLLRVNVSELNYVPEAGPEFERILKVVYGFPLFDPNTGAPTPKWVIHDERALEVLWRKRTRSEWIDLRSKLGVTNVVTPSFWKLDLPRVVSYCGRTAYEIPDR
jgi:hypothetical protein